MTLVYLAGAWLLGVVAGALTGDVWWPGVTAIAAGALAAAAVERRPHLILIGVLSAGLFAGGAMRFETQADGAPSGIALHNDAGTTRFRAVVSDEPDRRGRSQSVRLDVREIFFGERWVDSSGGVLMRSPLQPEYSYGDLLELRGDLETPPVLADFDYREYLARQGISSVVDYPAARTIATGKGNDAMAALHSLRSALGDALERALPEPQAALAQGILLGQRASISPELKADMNATGTSHLVAVSGQNVAIIAGLTITALAWLIGRRRAALVALLVIAGYTLLTGASPPVVRAAIMGGMFVIAELSGRPSSGLVAILLAAAIMTGIDPTVVEDVSFQLSFAAIIGLVYLTPLLQSRGAAGLRRIGIDPGDDSFSGFVLASAAVTAGAILATLPITALNFDRVSLVAPLANLLAVPAFPLVLVTSALAATFGAIWPPLGQVTAWAAWVPLTYMIESIRFCAELPLASFELEDFTSTHAAVAYAALLALGLWLARPSRDPWMPGDPSLVAMPRLRPVWAISGGLAIAASLAWWAALDSDDGRLTMHVLDVGQGDAILIETPDGRQILVDGGPNGEALIEAMSEELQVWDRTIDAVVLTHAQADHATGLLDVLERYDVELAIGPPLTAGTALERAWGDTIRREGIAYRAAQPGDSIDLGDGAVLEVLAPSPDIRASGEPNDASVVLRISWGEVDILLTGDIEAAGEASLLSSGAMLDSEVLKVAHHGSAGSTSTMFLREVSPDIAVISAGADNRFGHPSPGTLERLGDTPVLRTDLHGTISISTDGNRLWIERERD